MIPPQRWAVAPPIAAPGSLLHDVHTVRETGHDALPADLFTFAGFTGEDGVELLDVVIRQTLRFQAILQSFVVFIALCHGASPFAKECRMAPVSLPPERRKEGWPAFLRAVSS